ncbi:MAG: hypothetical protein HPY89_03645 [Pelotomaculum sp.]|nr:hypothetical protein [Pelotomaculum sp.]
MTNEEFQSLVLRQLQSLTESVKSLNGSVKSLEEGQKQLTNTVQSLEQGQQELKTSVQKIESKVDRLELRLENEAFYKIGALFDGFSLRGDQIENLKKHIDERFDSIETDTRYLVARVARLEKLAK